VVRRLCCFYQKWVCLNFCLRIGHNLLISTGYPKKGLCSRILLFNQKLTCWNIFSIQCATISPSAICYPVLQWDLLLQNLLNNPRAVAPTGFLIHKAPQIAKLFNLLHQVLDMIQIEIWTRHTTSIWEIYQRSCTTGSCWKWSQLAHVQGNADVCVYNCGLPTLFNGYAQSIQLSKSCLFSTEASFTDESVDTQSITDFRKWWTDMIDGCVETMETNLYVESLVSSLYSTVKDKPPITTSIWDLTMRWVIWPKTCVQFIQRSLTQLDLDGISTEVVETWDRYLTKNLASNCQGLVGRQIGNYTLCRDYESAEEDEED
jgi:hypothetical protein